MFNNYPIHINRVTRAIKKFPNNLPFLFESQYDDEISKNNLKNLCIIWKEYSYKSNYANVLDNNNNIIGKEFHAPNEADMAMNWLISDEQFFDSIISQIHWYYYGLINVDEAFISKIQNYIENLNVELVSKLAKKISEVGIIIAQNTVMFYLAVLEKNLSWITRNNKLEIYLEYMSNFTRYNDIEYQNQYSRLTDIKIMLAKDYPKLYKRYPQLSLRDHIISLSAHKIYQIKDSLFESLLELWGFDTKLIFQCISEVFKQTFAEQKKPVYDRDIDEMRNYQSILKCIPIKNLFIESRIFYMFRYFLNRTIYYYKLPTDVLQYDQWSGHSWNMNYFAYLSLMLMKMKNKDKDFFLAKISDELEECPQLVRDFLFYFVLIQFDKADQDRFFDIVLEFSQRILQSPSLKAFIYHDNLRNILSSIILQGSNASFSDISQDSLAKFSNFVANWCNLVGQNQLCFIDLTLLTSNGFPIAFKHGVIWLYTIITKNDFKNDRAFFEGDLNNKLAELLRRIWIEYKPDKMSEHFNEYLFLVATSSQHGSISSTQILEEIQVKSI